MQSVIEVNELHGRATPSQPGSQFPSEQHSAPAWQPPEQQRPSGQAVMSG
jgi:hypothetical protein